MGILGSQELRIDPAYAAALRACGLADLASILPRIDGRVAAWSRSTDTIHIAGRPGEPGFYLKRYFYTSWRKRIRTMFRGTFFGTHRGQAEYRSLQAMRALGISAARPVACGVCRTGHFVTACFLVTEEVPEACNLTSFAREVATGRRSVTRAERIQMIECLARQVAGMHAAGFSHGQLFWRNILVRHGPDGTPEFFFLDAQPMPAWRRLGPGTTWWQRELAHLTVSALPFTTRTERLRFLLAYFEASELDEELRAYAREIAAQARGWQRHELQRIKMNDLFEEWNRQLVREESGTARVEPARAAGREAARTAP